MAQPHKLASLQVLRWLAASLVLLDHLLMAALAAWPQEAAAPVLQIAYRLGGLGVMLFFAISGFLMVHLNPHGLEGWRGAGRFLARRIKRIWPLYALATLMVFAYRWRGTGEPDLLGLVQSLLFVPYELREGVFRPLLSQGWTLNYEMFFYFAFALAMVLPWRIGLALLTAGLVALAGGEFWHLELGSPWAFYFAPIVAFFVVGMCVAKLRPMWPHTWTPWHTLGSAAALVAAAFVPSSEEALATQWLNLAVVAAIMWLALQAPMPRARDKGAAILERLGDASYSTYLFHGFMLTALKGLAAWAGVQGSLALVVFVAAGLVAGNVLGLAIYRTIERPMLALMKRL